MTLEKQKGFYQLMAVFKKLLLLMAAVMVVITSQTRVTISNCVVRPFGNLFLVNQIFIPKLLNRWAIKQNVETKSSIKLMPE